MVYFDGLSRVGNTQNFLGNLVATSFEHDFAANVLSSIFRSETDLIHCSWFLSNVFYIFGEYISIFRIADRNRNATTTVKGIRVNKSGSFRQLLQIVYFYTIFLLPSMAGGLLERCAFICAYGASPYAFGVYSRRSRHPCDPPALIAGGTVGSLQREGVQGEPTVPCANKKYIHLITFFYTVEYCRIY